MANLTPNVWEKIDMLEKRLSAVEQFTDRHKGEVKAWADFRAILLAAVALASPWLVQLAVHLGWLK